jgi:OOP family OmpA-OmpF porin
VTFYCLGGAIAAEIITAEDFEQKLVSRDQLVKTADNFILLLDTSLSMEVEYKNTGKSQYEMLKSELKIRNTYLPDLGYNAGIYRYTPWEEVLPVQPYNQRQFAAALDKLPEKPGGSTDLQKGLENIEPILDKLSGRTVVFLFSDGSYNPWLGKKAPELIQKEISEDHNVCFYVISLAKAWKANSFLHELAAVNECSRVIPFEYYIARPEFNSGALFAVKSTERIETIADRKVVGLKMDPIHFDFNVDQVSSQYYQNLDAIGTLVKDNANGYAVIHGYTDSIGTVEYNMGLSRRRADAVATYLKNNYNISSDRLITDWYGPMNPVSSNATSDGRRKNRRVEIAIGGL